MKVLLSSYACGSAFGSKPGVGWRRAIGLARLGHEVRVVTAARNRPVIEVELVLRPRSNPQFRYSDIPGLGSDVREQTP